VDRRNWSGRRLRGIWRTGGVGRGRRGYCDLFRLFWRELTIIGARVYERHDFEGAVALLASGTLDVEPLISHVLPLASANEAFRVLEGGTDVLKVLISCQEA
jgi:(R,R)-butanediol dehydrogenase/meso-butanediol dehydrogenase/diacetyl reductase